MGLARTKRKICKKLGDPDRISTLPDEILGQILSFLPTKYAVATSSLASRWRNLYKLTTCLDFDDSLSFKRQKNSDAQFRKFVDSILVLCKEANVTKFRLKCDNHNFHGSLISRWIKVACFYKISELELSIHTHVRYSLPLELSTSTYQNLVVLKLDSDFEVNVPDSVSFPCLKVLVFKAIKLSTGCSLNYILYKCPLLEELVIEGCDIDEGNISITNPLLRRLTLDDGMTGPLDQLNGNVHYFNVPSLIYLKYFKVLADDGFTVRNLNALIEAHIDICFNDDDFYEPQDLSDAMLDLVIGVSNCQLLYFSGQCLEAITSGDFELPLFQNLTRLELGVGCDITWDDILLDFLNSSPCLESLIFVEGLVKWGFTQDEEIMLNDEEVPLCLESRLKVIKIRRFWGTKGEMDIVSYFLEKANMLEELELHWFKGKSEKYMLSKEEEILKLEKASEICSIEFK